MFSRLIRNRFYGAVSVFLGVTVMSCSSENTVTPTASIGSAFSKTVSGGSSDDFALSGPGAPSDGTVVEGESVPGIALGYTRAQVEEAYGDPQWCQSENYGDFAYCSFPVIGGGQVDVQYRGADGGPAGNSPDDVVYKIRWYEEVSGWVTTGGVNTTLAADDPDAVIAAYPDAQITFNQFGNIYSAIDYELGIEVFWVLDFYSGTTHVNMAIFYPTDPPPPPENLLRVTDIDMTASKVRGKRQVQAFVRVENERGQSVSGATVFAHWTYPDGSTRAVENTTYSTGYAYFQIVGIPRGIYELTVENVVLESYTFDVDNSILNKSIYVR